MCACLHVYRLGTPKNYTHDGKHHDQQTHWFLFSSNAYTYSMRLTPKLTVEIYFEASQIVLAVGTVTELTFCDK